MHEHFPNTLNNDSMIGTDFPTFSPAAKCWIAGPVNVSVFIPPAILGTLLDPFATSTSMLEWRAIAASSATSSGDPKRKMAVASAREKRNAVTTVRWAKKRNKAMGSSCLRSFTFFARHTN